MLDRSAWEEAVKDTPALIIVDGPNTVLTTRDSNLLIKDGPMGDKRERLIPRAKAKRVRQVMIMDNSGYVTGSALKWLSDHSIPVAMMDNATNADHRPRTLMTGSSYMDAGLIRRQAMCRTGLPLESVGLYINQKLITVKLEGQADNAENMLGDLPAAKSIRSQLEKVWLCDNTQQVNGPEGNAAEAYWTAWKGAAVSWRKPIPLQDHWLTYPGRKSYHYAESNADNRNATDPVNAMLNWGYKIAETLGTQALTGAGIAPELGISHSDNRQRESFALDLVEVMRPVVDRIVWRRFTNRMLRSWFTEEPGGLVTLRSPLTHELSAAIYQDQTPIHQAVFMIVKALREADV